MKSLTHVALFILSISILSFSISCKKTKTISGIPPGFKNYVHAFTSGSVSRAGSIEIQFANDVIDDSKVGAALDKGLLNLRPAIVGKGTWTSKNSLQYQPDEWLNSNTKYLASIDLKKLFPEIEKDLKSFDFNFQTKELYLNAKINSLKAVSSADLKNQILEGVVSSNDVVEDHVVEKAFNVSLTGQNPEILWEHLPNNREHIFRIKNILRNEEENELKLSWKENPLGSGQVQNTFYAIPSINDFKLMDAEVVQAADQYLQLRFSDPLKKNQSFKGLVNISGFEGKLRFDVDENELRVYPDQRLTGERTIKVRPGLQNIVNVKMQSPAQWKLAFEERKPQIRISGNGVILPNSEGLNFPFEAVNLNAIDLEIFKIYNNNVLQFLQSNNLGDEYRLYEVGNIVLQKKIDLKTINESAASNRWENYALDLDGLINQESGAIYQIRLGFKPSYTNYNCSGGNIDGLEENPMPNLDDNGEIISFYENNYYGIAGYHADYSYQNQENPCYSEYYSMDNFVRRNILASNIGIIAKYGNDGSVFAAVSDLRTAEPIFGAKVELFNFQQQLIRSLQTDSEGQINIQLDKIPGFMIARSGADVGYVNMSDGYSLSTSRFDVGGAYVQKGLKGFIYGDRGVWRPGDTLFLNFVLEDLENKLPAEHPVSFELYDARNQLAEKKLTTSHVNHIYPFTVATSSDDPTGNWRLAVKVGGANFSKILKIETIKPNRLKIDLSFENDDLGPEDSELNADLQVNWLHGAPARNLQTKVEMDMKSVPTKFNKFNNYVFDDPARKYTSQSKVIFDKEIDENGSAKISAQLAKDPTKFPGKVKVNFKARAFEKGGDFSERNTSIDYFPFNKFAGINIPTNKYGEKRILIGKNNPIDLVVVDKEGNSLSNQNISVGLYEVNWRWWWENNDSDVNKFNSSTHFNALKKTTLKTDQKGSGSWNVNVDHWGRYMLRVCDTESGHCSGDFFYAGYPWYGEGGEGQNTQAASMLLFKSGKEVYEVGEQATLSIPTSEGSKVLITLETGDRVVESHTINSEAEETTFSFYTSAEMSPTVYAHVALIQQHGNKNNDLPIRMYGVIPIRVENSNTRLTPTIKMVEVLEPKAKVKIEIEEDNNKPMAYTLAVVDEGLLDLTNFKTPNPWDAFYAREALGVRTWDIYDYVLGAYGGQMNRILSIGGDVEVVPDRDKNKANRFKPVAKHFGPFYLKKGEKAVHEFTMPNYVGSVRVMAVASNNGAYGAAEKTCPVRKPLMVLATLPRVLGPGERLSLPVSVFAMDKKVKETTISVKESSGKVQFLGPTVQSLSFNGPDEKMVYFDFEVPNLVGLAKFTINAEGGGEIASQEIEIDIRNPNPFVSEFEDKILQAGQSWSATIDPLGVIGTNNVNLELSSIPPLNLNKWLNYLIKYPHGCVEQTTSAVFAQLFLDEIMELDQGKKDRVDYYIREAIHKMSRFQLSNGGLSYWPGNTSANYWGSTYVAHFLLEAKAKGYVVPGSLIDKLIAFQRKTARSWTVPTQLEGYYSGNYYLDQAYRLYTLALAGEAEYGAMNRLRSDDKLPATAKWRLAAAYALAGQKEAALELVENAETRVKDYREMSYTFGSGNRDEAMILETMVLLDEKEAAARMAKEIADDLGTLRWLNTHTLAYSILAYSKLAKDAKLTKEIQFAYQLGSKQKVNAGTKNPIFAIDVPVDRQNIKTFDVQNTGEGILYARLIKTGQPLVGNETPAEKNLKIDVTYKNINGEIINPVSIEQGVDFIAEVKVSNTSKTGKYYREMALTQTFPSGWEISNTRMSSVSGFEDTSHATYKDIRDDRVYTYFDIAPKATKTFRVQLNAAYPGRYYLAGPSCEAMYDDGVYAREAGRWVQVAGLSAL